VLELYSARTSNTFERFVAPHNHIGSERRDCVCKLIGPAKVEGNSAAASSLTLCGMRKAFKME